MHPTLENKNQHRHTSLRFGKHHASPERVMLKAWPQFCAFVCNHPTRQVHHTLFLCPRTQPLLRPIRTMHPTCEDKNEPRHTSLRFGKHHATLETVMLKAWPQFCA